MRKKLKSHVREALAVCEISAICDEHLRTASLRMVETSDKPKRQKTAAPENAASAAKEKDVLQYVKISVQLQVGQLRCQGRQHPAELTLLERRQEND